MYVPSPSVNIPVDSSALRSITPPCSFLKYLFVTPAGITAVIAITLFAFPSIVPAFVTPPAILLLFPVVSAL